MNLMRLIKLTASLAMGDMIRATSSDAWLRTPMTLHVLLAVLTAPPLAAVGAALAATTLRTR